jgi:hypothetical protein
MQHTGMGKAFTDVTDCSGSVMRVCGGARNEKAPHAHSLIGGTPPPLAEVRPAHMISTACTSSPHHPTFAPSLPLAQAASSCFVRMCAVRAGNAGRRTCAYACKTERTYACSTYVRGRTYINFSGLVI